MVSVPRLQRIEPSQATPRNDRINMQVNSGAEGILNQTKAVAGLAEEGVDLYKQVEDEKISTLSYETEKQFNDWNQAQQAKLKNLDPDTDPTEAYAEYDKAVATKREELLGSLSGVSDRVRRNVESSFSQSLDKNNTSMLYQRGQKQEIYKNNAYEKSLKNKRNSLSDVVGYAGFEAFDATKSEIIETIAKRGIETGLATELDDKADPRTVDYKYKKIEIGEDGKEFTREVKVKLTDAAKVRVAEELQKGTREAIDTLIGSGQLDKAKEMSERYKGYLSGKDLIQINNKFKNEDTVNEANNFLATVGSKLSTEQRKELEAIEDPSVRLLRSQEMEDEVITQRLGNNPELLTKTLALKESRDTKLQKLQTAQQERNYTALNDALEKAIQNGEINGIADLETSPTVKALYNATWDKMSPKQKQAIHESIRSPAISNPKSISKVQDVLMSEQVGTMSMNQFKVEYLTGLSKADRDHYTTIFQEFGKPEMTKQRAINQRAEKFLKSEMLSKRVIKTGDGNKLSRKNQDKYDQARAELLNILSTRGNMNDNDVQEYVRQYVAGELTAKTKTERNVFGLRPESSNLSGRNSGSTFNPDGAKLEGNQVKFNSPAAAKAQITAYMQTTGLKFNPKSESDRNRFNLWVSKKYGWN